MLRGVGKYLTEDELIQRYAQEGNQLTEPLWWSGAKEKDVTSLDSDESRDLSAVRKQILLPFMRHGGPISI